LLHQRGIPQKQAKVFSTKGKNLMHAMQEQANSLTAKPLHKFVQKNSALAKMRKNSPVQEPRVTSIADQTNKKASIFGVKNDDLAY